MRIVLWAKGNRGVTCLRSLHERGHHIVLVVGQPHDNPGSDTSAIDVARSLALDTIAPVDPNRPPVAQQLRSYEPELFILAGYGPILKQSIIDIPSRVCLNLHAGQLPKYRGSSPLNWALINDETSFTLSIVKVDARVDAGDVLLEWTFPIDIDDTIRDLHRIANQQFPEMVLHLLDSLADGSENAQPQDRSQGSYYPLRFPDDGLILWDLFTAEQIHNRIRALTEPYPCAFTYANGRRIKLLSSKLQQSDHFGEPGRVYRKTDRGLLVCGLDKCLWITSARFEDTGDPIFDAIGRYDMLATVRRSVQMFEETRRAPCS